MKSLHIDQYEYELQIFGNDFIILKNESCGALINSMIAKAILERQFDFVKEAIASEEEILIALKKPINQIEHLSQIVLEKEYTSQQWTLPFLLDSNADWDEIQTSTGLNQEEYLNLLLQTNLTMLMNGFLPGFSYLTGLPKALHCPRKRTPSTNIKSGSVAIGGPYVGIYPIDSPGGWNVIGHTPIRLINGNRMPPSFLSPGDTVKLKLIDNEQYDLLKKMDLDLNAYHSS